MADKSAIEWTDATWNPIRGCSRVSEGCRHCYAEVMAARFSGEGEPYEGLAQRVQKPDGSTEARWTGAITIASERTLRLPLHWNKPRRIFVNSMSDLFHDAVRDQVIDRIFAIMAFCPQHTFQILTKRPERMRHYFQIDSQAFHDRQFEALEWVAKRSRFESIREACEHHGVPWRQPTCAEDRYPLPNVWLGVSVEDQVTADTRIPYLMKTPAAVRFISAEPLLGPIGLLGSIDLRPVRGLDWVIAGGESGRNSRPMHPAWARGLRDECSEAGIPFFFKQWGEWKHRPDLAHFKPMLRVAWQRTASQIDGVRPALMVREGKKPAGRELDGCTHDAFPAVRHG